MDKIEIQCAMERFLKKYRPKKLKPVIYKLFRRLVTGLVFALLWDRFVNTQKLFSMVEHAFFVLGAFFFVMAWINYLKIDGVIFHYLNEDRKRVKKPKPKTGSMIDYVEQEPAPADSADSDSEEPKTALISNLLAGLCFILPSLFSLLFQE